MVKKFFTKRKLNILISALAVLLMWLVWIVAYYCVGNRLIVPSFSETVSCFWRYLGSGSFWLAVLNSLLRTLLAFIISFVPALACAVSAAFLPRLKAALKPIMTFIRTLPTMAVILLILKITRGDKTFSPVIVTVLVLLPMIYSQANATIEGIDGELTEMAEVFLINRRDRLFKIYLPLVSPGVLSQTGANISIGLKIMISAEVLANTANGLGGMMQLNNIAAEVANLAALTLAAVILGLIIDFAFSLLERTTFKWTRKEGRSD